MNCFRFLHVFHTQHPFSTNTQEVSIYPTIIQQATESFPCLLVLSRCQQSLRLTSHLHPHIIRLDLRLVLSHEHRQAHKRKTQQRPHHHVLHHEPRPTDRLSAQIQRRGYAADGSRHELNQSEARIRRDRDAWEVVERERESLGLEASVGSAVEEIGDAVDPGSLRLVVENHEKLAEDLRNGADDDDVIGAEAIADVRTDFAVDDLGD